MENFIMKAANLERPSYASLESTGKSKSDSQLCYRLRAVEEIRLRPLPTPGSLRKFDTTGSSILAFKPWNISSLPSSWSLPSGS
jgi:hypothetical protein